MNPEPFKEFVALYLEKEQLEKRIKQIGARTAVLSKNIEEQFVAEGCAKLTIDGYTVAPSSRPVGSPLCDRGELADAMSALGDHPLAKIVKPNYNANTFNSFLSERQRELLADCQASGEIYDLDMLAQALPESIRPLVKLSLLTTIRATKAGASTFTRTQGARQQQEEDEGEKGE